MAGAMIVLNVSRFNRGTAPVPEGPPRVCHIGRV